jgi:hypothetical protein
MVKPALRMLLAEGAEKTWRKLALAVIDQVPQVRYPLEQAHNGSPCHVLLGRLFNDGFVINHIWAGIIDCFLVNQYVRKARLCQPIRIMAISVRLLGVEP